MAEIRIPVENLPAPDKNGDHAFNLELFQLIRTSGQPGLSFT